MPLAAIDTAPPPEYELTGAEGAPVIVVLGGISAGRRAADWWPEVVRDGGHVDTTRFRVFGFDWLDGGEGPDGRPLRAVSTHDQADALAAALDDAGVSRAHSVVGASYGGMVGLAFAERHPDRLEQLIAISAPARAHAMSSALRSIQRGIVELGLDTGRPFDALSLARRLAMTTYRSAAEFDERFADAAGVESYLAHHGEKFARRFTAARFLALSLSADTHRVEPRGIATPALFVSAEGDTIVPRGQIVSLARDWGGRCTHRHTATRTGHDAFLAEPRAVGALIRNALDTSVLS